MRELSLIYGKYCNSQHMYFEFESLDTTETIFYA